MPQLSVRPLEAGDKEDWRRLWTDYLAFYETRLPDTVYDETWRRLFTDGDFEPRGLLATLDGKPVGLTHFLFHRSCWSLEGNCYLQDLFTDQGARGHGVGAALIEAVRQAAARRGVANVYWMTNETNVVARRLYDHVARRTGFIEYDLL
ncbi:GNAT family N-acetyltransferase [Salmonella enterica subsp. enterica]|nr:GNAT family N-acetyltransferase [Salmonella enterica subsp. enterica serovar Enteritidis]